jgi:hypothetical protein
MSFDRVFFKKLSKVTFWISLLIFIHIDYIYVYAETCMTTPRGGQAQYCRKGEPGCICFGGRSNSLKSGGGGNSGGVNPNVLSDMDKKMGDMGFKMGMDNARQDFSKGLNSMNDAGKGVKGIINNQKRNLQFLENLDMGPNGPQFENLEEDDLYGGGAPDNLNRPSELTGDSDVDCEAEPWNCSEATLSPEVSQEVPGVSFGVSRGEGILQNLEFGTDPETKEWAAPFIEAIQKDQDFDPNQEANNQQPLFSQINLSEDGKTDVPSLEEIKALEKELGALDQQIDRRNEFIEELESSDSFSEDEKAKYKKALRYKQAYGLYKLGDTVVGTVSPALGFASNIGQSIGNSINGNAEGAADNLTNAITSRFGKKFIKTPTGKKILSGANDIDTSLNGYISGNTFSQAQTEYRERSNRLKRFESKKAQTVVSQKEKLQQDEIRQIRLIGEIQKKEDEIELNRIKKGILEPWTN